MYLGLFEAVGKGLSLLHCAVKMVFSGFPLTCRCRGDTRNRVRKVGDRQKRYRSSVDQIATQRVQLSSVLMLPEYDETLNHQREHKPRPSGVGLTANRQPRALFIKNCKCALAIAGVSQLSKKRSSAEPLDRAPRFGGGGGLGMR